MLGKANLVIDTMSEVYSRLRSYKDGEFWDFASHEPWSNSVYVLGRQQVVENKEKFRSMAQDPRYLMIFGNSAEGSDTLVSQLRTLGLEDLALEKKILLISGGDLDGIYPHVRHDYLLSSLFDYEENRRQSVRIEEVFDKKTKPYQFLFLNGRARPHRKYLWERFRMKGLLDQSLWTMLDSRPSLGRSLRLRVDDVNLMGTTTPLRWLPKQYECPRFQAANINPGPADRCFMKTELFNNLWGEIYLQADPYIDTYFSLVTETVLSYPYSFRTEKIAKPLGMGHPWICASGRGFYRDLRNLGFRTFSHVIDEDFDLIDNDQDRMDRIVQIVADLCQDDLISFLAECEEVCKYNQQHLYEFSSAVKTSFADTFIQFIEPYIHARF